MIVEVVSPNVADARVCLQSPTDKESRISGISSDKDDWWLSLPTTRIWEMRGSTWTRPCYPEKFSGQAYRMGINFVM